MSDSRDRPAGDVVLIIPLSEDLKARIARELGGWDRRFDSPERIAESLIEMLRDDYAS